MTYYNFHNSIIKIIKLILQKTNSLLPFDFPSFTPFPGTETVVFVEIKRIN